MKILPPEITVRIDGKMLTCTSTSYVTAKTKQLREFGYSSLTEANVAQQVLCLLNREESALTVIGWFMEEEVRVEKEPHK